MSTAVLTRQMFTTSRELEYLTESELVTQTGYPRSLWWPGVLVKELLDNALDACEQAGVNPDIAVTVTPTGVTVTDNGPGIAPDLIGRIIDLSTRTSDKAAYISPTRGAQGNALKTILGIMYVLTEGAGAVEIESQGIRHRITVSIDQIRRKPVVNHSQEVVKTEGTAVRVSACSNGTQSSRDFLPKLLFDYSLFNPNASFTLVEDGSRQFTRQQAAFDHWLPSYPTPPHW
jgi:DNA topoisomerase VI subunit B